MGAGPDSPGFEFRLGMSLLLHRAAKSRDTSTAAGGKRVESKQVAQRQVLRLCLRDVNQPLILGRAHRHVCLGFSGWGGGR
jgi:hypothetical protein